MEKIERKEAEMIPKEHLGLAAEYAVASELCRRGIYAQLTLGTRKRTDILAVLSERMLGVEVKGKQDKTWPLSKGICGEDKILVFVDYYEKKKYERPDFYILNAEDWLNLVHKQQGPNIATGDVEIKDGVPIFCKNLNKYGKPTKGISVSVSHVKDYWEKWDKIKEGK